MTRRRLVDQYFDTLREDPDALPPPGLDAETAALIRRIVHGCPVPTPGLLAQDRIWQRALRTADPNAAPTAETNPPLSNNGRTADNSPDKEYRKMTLITQHQKARILPQKGRMIALAALLAVVVFGGFLLMQMISNDSAPSVPAAIYLSPEQANMAVFEQYINEAWNQGNTTVLDEIMILNVICHEPGAPAMEGAESVSTMILDYRTAFPDLNFEIVALGASEDEVWARMVFNGTQTGELVLPDGTLIPPSDVEATINEMWIARFEGGKIAEVWSERDSLGLMTQIAVVPAVEQAVREAHNLQSALTANAMWPQEELVTFEEVSAVYDNSVFVYTPTASSGTTLDQPKRTVHNIHDVINAYQNHFLIHNYTVLDTFVNGDTVAVHYQIEDTQLTRYSTWIGKPLDAISEPETYEGVTIYRFEDGKIAEEWWYLDYARYQRADLCN